MTKWLLKAEKLKIIKISKIKAIDKTALKYGVGQLTIKEWIKNGINKFNKWDKFLTKIIKNNFLWI